MDGDLATERLRGGRWHEYLNEPGLTRGQVGQRILEARNAGYRNADVADMMGRSVSWVSSLAALVKRLGAQA